MKDEHTSNETSTAGDATKTRGEAKGGVRAASVASVGALCSAILASACCRLPLLLIAFGVSGGALSARFEALRPVLLPVTFVLLGVAFYFTYRKPKSAAKDETCCAVPGVEATGESCCPPEGTRGFTLKKLNKVMLWVVTAFVLAFAFFPNYVGAFIGGGSTQGVSADLTQVTLELDGMTCEACAVTIQKSLARVPGVAAAEVSFERKTALVGISKGAHIPRDAILKAINDAGYTGRFKNGGK